MLAEFSVAPLGQERGLSRDVARLQRLIAASGLPHQLHAMGTLIEGTTDEVFDLIKACHREMRQRHRRVVTTVKIDDCEGRMGALRGKVTAVEARLRQA